MKQRWIKAAAACLALTLAVPVLTPAQAAWSGETAISVGLFYGSSALPSANLENSVGSGYRLGYFDGSAQFTELGRISETKISMLKTQNLYLSGGVYGTSGGAGAQVIGCWHIRLPGSYGDFSAAQAAAAASGGFPAWIDGTYQVRLGAYADEASARAAMTAAGISGEIVGTGPSGISVLATGTDRILFQFDGGTHSVFGVMPDVTGEARPVTWFKGYKYYGGFRYERLNGGDITVSNLLELEDYIDCVISQEMSDAWPLEALKAQACAARTYALKRMSSAGAHKDGHFDVCNSVHCQAYPGMKLTGGNTRQAVEETEGLVIRYNNALIDAVYSSSDGGATENAENVWYHAEPYLRGKTDPYEAAIASSIPNYNWTVTFTADELTTKLRASGRSCAQIVDFRVTETTPTGNVKTITFTDAAGKSWSFQKESARTFLGLRSQRYTVTGSGGGGSTSSGGISVNGGNTRLESVLGLYAIDGSGTTAQMSAVSPPRIITSSGVSQLSGGAGSGGDTFLISGSGYGHNVGMSQYGANAMAKAGYTYDQILHFYYTGVEISQ